MDTPLQPALALVPPFNNQFLFSDHYLLHLLPQDTRWNDALEETRALAEFLRALYAREKKQLAHYNEAQLEQNWIRKILAQLGHVFEAQASVPGLGAHISRPDYVFFATDAERQAATKTQKTSEYARHALAAGEVKAWDVALGKKIRGGGPSFDAQNPSWQIAQYVSAMGLTWGILSNGREWRLVHKDSSGRLAIFYQVDLVDLLARDDVSALRYFTLFFSQAAFRPDALGRVFLDDAYNTSIAYARELEQDLRENVYRALEQLMQGFVDLPANRLNADDLREIYDNSLYLLYRLLFILFGESRGLLPLQNERYRANYSLDTMKKEIVALKHKPAQRTTNYWGRLKNLFQIINGDDAELNRELGVPRYNGGLFSPTLHPFLENIAVGDRALVEAMDLLSRRNGEFVDYRTLGVRQLGSIYEGLLEYQPQYAAQAMVAVRDGKGEHWMPETDAPPNAKVGERRDAGAVFLATDRGERKATGSYYTPEYIVQYIVQNTLAPLVQQARETIAAPQERERALSLADAVLNLRVLDPAMGSGHFLVDAMEFLALELANDPYLQEEIPGDEDLLYWKRRVVERCIYGVDKNPLAVELAKLSLWLATVASDQPLSFLDHHLKHGDSLIGARVKELGSAPPVLLTKKQLAQQQAGQINLFAYRLAQQLPIVLGKILEITNVASDSYERVQLKEVANETIGKLKAPFEQVAHLWTSAYFGNEFAQGEYGEALDLMPTPEKLFALPALQRAQTIARERDFFHWELAFPEVFFDRDGNSLGERAGFDAVISNPPYIDIKGLEKSLVKYLFSMFTSTQLRANIFAAFIDQALQLLRLGIARVGFIVPTAFLTQVSYSRLRQIILKEYWLCGIVRLPNELFGAAAGEVKVDTCIIVVQKANAKPSVSTEILIYNSFERVNEISPQTATHSFQEKQGNWLRNSDATITLSGQNTDKVVEKMKARSVTLEGLCEFCLGITPYDKYSGHTQAQIENQVFHAKSRKDSNYRKLLKSGDVSRYVVKWNGQDWIKYGSWLAAPRERRFFTTPRILVQQIIDWSSLRIFAGWTDEELYNTQNQFNLLARDQTNLMFVLGILNSKLISYYHRRVFLDLALQRFQKILIKDAKTFPIPRIVISTPASERARLAAELAQAYEDALAENDVRDILERVTQHLAASPAQSDVVHDFLAQLAQQMIDGNKEKQMVTRAFWDDLEGVSDAAAFKALQKGKQEASLLRASDIFQPLLRADSHATRTLEESLAWSEQAFKAFAKALASRIKNLSDLVSVYRKHSARYSAIAARLRFTDALIDEIVYRLYDLSVDEIKIVKGEQKT